MKFASETADSLFIYRCHLQIQKHTMEMKLIIVTFEFEEICVARYWLILAPFNRIMYLFFDAGSQPAGLVQLKEMAYTATTFIHNHIVAIK